MANKELTARVKFDTSSAEAKLRRLNTLITNINKAVTGHAKTGKLESSLARQVVQAEKVKQATLKTEIAQEKLSQEIGKTFVQEEKVNQALIRTEQLQNKTKTKANETAQSTKKWSNALDGVNTKLNKSSNHLGIITGKLKNLINTYLGVMGMKGIINTSDMITSAENKLNYVSAQQLGASGTNADGSYSTATYKATQDAMDKMYASSQKVRMGYGDMMANVSKSMALAGDAFNNNTDMAIRFQEVMAEAYAVGGASAQEMSSSMYQLIQALGSGTLAGDELRSVREGAPLAYKAIEEFAQGVYNTTDSLKDLGSQGKITADIVTAAIMSAGDEMDKAFAQTEQTFAQTWTQIKNVAIRAFKPISEQLRKSLNDAVDNGLLQKVETIFSNIAKAIMIVFKVTSDVIHWIGDNWNWLKYVIGTVLLVATVLLIKLAATAVWSATVTAAKWLWANKILIIIAVTIMLLLWVWEQFTSGAISACEALTYALAIVGIAILIIGLITQSTTLVIIGFVLLVVLIIFMGLEQISGGVTWLISFIWNCVQFIVGVVMGCIMVIIAIAINCIIAIINGIGGLVSVASVACENIGIFFSNLWNGASAAFWTFIGDVLTGLSDLEPAFNALAKLFGLEGVTLSGLTQGAYDKANDARGKITSYGSITDAWNEGSNVLDYLSIGDAWSTGYNIIGTPFEEGWSSNAYNMGADWAAGLKGSLNDWASQFQNTDDKGKTSLLDEIGKKLGLDFSGITFPTDGVGDMLGDIGDSLGGIGDDTGKISDSMDLTEDDLEYLRKIADMEWKKEFTTANITVDMSNYNTISGENDLDGIVTKLSDKLYEELNIVANGVYA